MKGVSEIGWYRKNRIDPSFRSPSPSPLGDSRAFRISRRNSARIRERKPGQQRFPAVSRGYFSCFARKPVIFLTALALRRYLPPSASSFFLPLETSVIIEIEPTYLTTRISPRSFLHISPNTSRNFIEFCRLTNDSPLFGSTINSSPSKKKRKNRDITRITWTHYTNYNKSTKIWRIIRDNSRLSREITSERG